MSHEIETVERYAIRLPGVVVLSSVQALLDVQRLLEGVVGAAANGGVLAPRRLRDLLAACESAQGERSQIAAIGSTNYRLEADVSAWSPGEEIGSEEAGKLLGIKARQVCNRAGELGGRKVGRAWRFNRAVVAEADRRSRGGAT